MWSYSCATLQAFVRGKGTPVPIDKLSTIRSCVVSFTHYLLCACGNISWYPTIRSLCESQSWCKHFGGRNIFFLCLDQTTIPCSLSLWPADHTTFTGLTHLIKSTNHKIFHVILSILFLLILLDPNNFLGTVFQIRAVSALSATRKTEIQPELYV